MLSAGVAACGSDTAPKAASTTTVGTASSTSLSVGSVTSTSNSVGTTTTLGSASTTVSVAKPSTTSTPAIKPVIGVDGCGLLPLPAGATVTATKTGDVNGDSKPDTLTTYFVGATPGFRVVFGGGGGFQNPIGYAGAGNGVVKALGLTSLVGQATPGDKSSQVFVRIGNGASTQIVGLYFYENCAMKPVSFPNGADATFVVGGGVMHADGLACDGVAGGVVLAVQSANSNNGSKFVTTVQGYRYANGALAKYGSLINGTINLPADSATFESFGTIGCAGIEI